MKKYAPLGGACLLALLLLPRAVLSAPAFQTWEPTVTQIFSDTLAHGVNDSVSVTQSVPVFGARAVMLLYTSTGSDSVALPVLQTQLVGSSDWVGAGGTVNVPYSGLTQGTPTTITTAVTGLTRCVFYAFNEPTIAGSYALPLVNTLWRWRIKGNPNMLRQYTNVPGNPALGSTGTITVRAVVWR